MYFSQSHAVIHLLSSKDGYADCYRRQDRQRDKYGRTREGEHGAEEGVSLRGTRKWGIGNFPSYVTNGFLLIMMYTKVLLPSSHDTVREIIEQGVWARCGLTDDPQANFMSPYEGLWIT